MTTPYTPGTRVRVTMPYECAIDRRTGQRFAIGIGALGKIRRLTGHATYLVRIADRDFDLPHCELEPLTPPLPDPGPYPSRPAGLYEEIGGEG